MSLEICQRDVIGLCHCRPDSFVAYKERLTSLGEYSYVCPTCQRIFTVWFDVNLSKPLAAATEWMKAAVIKTSTHG